MNWPVFFSVWAVALSFIVWCVPIGLIIKYNDPEPLPLLAISLYLILTIAVAAGIHP